MNEILAYLVWLVVTGGAILAIIGVRRKRNALAKSGAGKPTLPGR